MTTHERRLLELAREPTLLLEVDEEQGQWREHARQARDMLLLCVVAPDATPDEQVPPHPHAQPQEPEAGLAMIGGYLVPFLNCVALEAAARTELVSETLEILADGCSFACGWFQRHRDGKFVYSLRSHDHGVDVSEVARRYGGGGAPRAASFTLDHLLPMEHR